MKETLMLQVGQCGNQMGTGFWKLLCAEHGIDAGDGSLIPQAANNELPLDRKDLFFYESDNMKYVPRSVLIDLEPRVIDTIKKGPLGSLFNPENIYDGQEVGGGGAGNNWGEGYDLGAKVDDVVFDMLDREVENCDNLGSITMCHSIAGGTGSGLGSYLLEKIHDNYAKKIVQTYSVFPNMSKSGGSDTVVQPYNCILTLRRLAQYCHSVVVLDNTALERIAVDCLRCKPDFAATNALVANVMAASTATMRYPAELNTDILSIISTLVPFHRMHFLMAGYTPLTSDSTNPRQVAPSSDTTSTSSSSTAPLGELNGRSASGMAAGDARIKQYVQKTSTYEVMRRLLQPKNMMMSAAGLSSSRAGRSDDVTHGYIAVQSTLQGDIDPSDISRCIMHLHEGNKINYVPKMPAMLNICHAGRSPYIQHAHRVTGVMLANHTSISKLFARAHEQYSLMMTKGAYLNKFQQTTKFSGADGMSEMTESAEEVTSLINQYKRMAQGDWGEMGFD